MFREESIIIQVGAEYPKEKLKVPTIGRGRPKKRLKNCVKGTCSQGTCQKKIVCQTGYKNPDILKRERCDIEDEEEG